MIPAEPRIAAAMAETGMDRLQAIRHLQQRDAIARNRIFAECGCCGHWHRPAFAGDCRDDAERFSTSDLEDVHGEALDGITLEEIEA